MDHLPLPRCINIVFTTLVNYSFQTGQFDFQKYVAQNLLFSGMAVPTFNLITTINVIQ